MEPPLLLTPEEAATTLRIGRTRLYAFLADGTIPSVQIGHSRRVSVQALQDYVRRLEGHPPILPSLPDGMMVLVRRRIAADDSGRSSPPTPSCCHFRSHPAWRNSEHRRPQDRRRGAPL